MPSPAAQMKTKREHRVPLCRRAIEILDAARTLGGGPLVFPSEHGKPLDDKQPCWLLRQHSIPAVAHGFRSSFRHGTQIECGTTIEEARRDAAKI